MARTTLEDKVKKLEAELKETKARMSQAKRKERNGQLVSIGIMFEMAYKGMTPDEQSQWKKRAENLDERNRGRVLSAFQRLSSGDESSAPGGKFPSEPPSQ